MCRQQPGDARPGFGGRFGGNKGSSGRPGRAERSYSKTVESHSGRDQSLPWLVIPNNVPDNAIALPADVLEDWVRVMSEITAMDYGSDLAHGISISDADDFIYSVPPVRPHNIEPDDPGDPEDVREAKFENDLNSKTFFHHLGRSGDRRQKMDDDKTKVHVMMLMQCSETVRLRVRKSVTGAAAENGRCPRALIRALQVALYTNNRHDPLEKVDTARYALASIYHLKNEPLMDLRK
jgi:hypothetical protein